MSGGMAHAWSERPVRSRLYATGELTWAYVCTACDARTRRRHARPECPGSLAEQIIADSILVEVQPDGTHVYRSATLARLRRDAAERFGVGAD